VAIDVAEQIVAVLNGRPARYAVNAPAILPETMAVLEPYMELARSLGSMATQLAEGQLCSVEVTYAGKLANLDTAPLKAMLIKGLLQPVLAEDDINLVNASVIAKSRGLQVTERKTEQVATYSNLITIEMDTACSTRTVAGTILLGEPHLVRVDEYWVDIALTQGQMVFGYYRDRPGMIGHFGSVLGSANVNISFMAVSRRAPKGEALMVIGVDEPVSPDLVKRMLAAPDVHAIRTVVI